MAQDRGSAYRAVGCGWFCLYPDDTRGAADDSGGGRPAFALLLLRADGAPARMRCTGWPCASWWVKRRGRGPLRRTTWVQKEPSAPPASFFAIPPWRSEEHTSELQSRGQIVYRLLIEKKKKMHSLIL